MYSAIGAIRSDFILKGLLSLYNVDVEDAITKEFPEN
jgi:hypothetical protein